MTMNQAVDPTSPTNLEFAASTPEELLHRLACEGDRAPLALAEACVAHGEAMVEALRGMLDGDRASSGDEPGQWWLSLHAAFILGRIPSRSAGLLLVRLMRLMDERGDEDLQDWVAGDWPALFANKPESVLQAVRDLVTDTSLDWYIRCQGVDVLLDAGLRVGGQALEDIIDWAASLARDESDEWLLRISAASALLDFPRPRHRALLEAMAREDQRREAENGYGFVGMYVEEDVDSAFALNKDEPNWRRRGDPWKFYSPDAIAARQQRWREEDARAESDAARWDAPTTYVRTTPRVGRNEPCPCGSGKKYKRCCLARDQAIAKHAIEQT